MVNYRRTISAAHLVGNEYWTDSAMRRVITYGTFDLLHYGHIRLLQRCKEQGDDLVVALSGDEFNAGKGKKSYCSYEERKHMPEAIRYVDIGTPADNAGPTATTVDKSRM